MDMLPKGNRPQKNRLNLWQFERKVQKQRSMTDSETAVEKTYFIELGRNFIVLYRVHRSAVFQTTIS